MMKSKAEKEIYCEVKNIHRPKPKKYFKINDCFKVHSRWAHGPKKISKKRVNEFNNKNAMKKLDFDSISMEEIEKDFINFKAKEEELKVENELYKLLIDKPKCEKNNRKKIKSNYCHEDDKNFINNKDK